MLDFTELSDDGQEFEQLIRELLFSLGFKVFWSGRGPDGGRDLLCLEERESIFHKDVRRWLVQCKHKARSQSSVGINDLDDIVDSCTQHDCEGYLLVTSTQPSSAVVQRLQTSRKPNVAPLAAPMRDPAPAAPEMAPPTAPLAAPMPAPAAVLPATCPALPLPSFAPAASAISRHSVISSFAVSCPTACR